MIRISTIISFGLTMGIIFGWLSLARISHDKYRLWMHGKTAVVLPINDYRTNVYYKNGTKEVIQTHYVANLSVRLTSGEIANIPKKPVTLEEIDTSHQTEMRVVFLPADPETNYFVGKEPRLSWALIMASTFSLAGFIWFRRGKD